MLEGVRSRIRDGKDTMFWTSHWLNSRVKLIDMITQPDISVDLETPVCEFVTKSGIWDMDRLRPILNDDAICEIMGMTPSGEDRGEDAWVWGEEINGWFSIRSAYDLILKPVNNNPDVDWNWVWKWIGPSRVQHFLWLVTHDRLLTNLERKRRHISDSSSCPRCRDINESVPHVLWDCPFAALVWDEIGSP
ncbi:Putative ribonuclease H protein At1g65750 [Linum perenne]